ncbi:MAG TPA: sortase [Rubrobacter sp.]|nr:sortase [Rubrobacter sp.]
MLFRMGVFMMTFALAFVAVVAFVAFLDEPMEPAAAVRSTAKPAVEPLVRSDPGVDPWVEKNVRAPRPEPEPQPVTQPEPVAEQAIAPQPEPELEASPEPKLEASPELDAQPGPEPVSGSRGSVLPVGDSDWPLPTGEQIEAANRPRQYDLAPGAIMGLTVGAIGLYDVPVLDSDGQRALDSGVVHVPETSLPWSQTPERNVYLAGHRLGWPGTGSHLVFYRLDELGVGDEISLRDRDGRKYRYRVIDTLIVNPDDTWVMGRVRGRDLLTLQTCTPIPSFDKRLIVRAERV